MPSKHLHVGNHVAIESNLDFHVSLITASSQLTRLCAVSSTKEQSKAPRYYDICNMVSEYFIWYSGLINAAMVGSQRRAYSDVAIETVGHIISKSRKFLHKRHLATVMADNIKDHRAVMSRTWVALTPSRLGSTNLRPATESQLDSLVLTRSYRDRWKKTRALRGGDIISQS